jgi:NAD(P) transhydrogenase subunit alpha
MRPAGLYWPGLLAFPPAAAAPRRDRPMDLLTELTIFVLACFVGFEVISKVPNTLHTPLMSGTNAIHGIVILGGFIALATATDDTLGKVLAFIAIVFGTVNVVGGFLVTDRMLEMFKQRPKPKRAIEPEVETEKP